jgi:dipeptidyl-peptidase 4
MTQASWLTLDALVESPRPGTTAPTQYAFSPDGHLLTYLWSERGDPVRDLWVMDVATGNRRALLRADDLGPVEDLGTEETLRRERQRVRDSGITQYQWAKSADVLLIPFNGQLYVTDGAGARPRHIAPSDAAVVDARLTADGTHIVFARARELWAVSVETGGPVQLTFDSSDVVSNGVAEFIAQEEMGRAHGFWLSPDAVRVAYAQVDEGHIPEYPIVHQAGEQWRVENHRYPFAGGPNARVRLGIVPLRGGATQWLDLGPSDDAYVARVDWGDCRRLFVQLEARDQKSLELRCYDAEAGSWSTLFVERTVPWVNLHNDLRILGDGSFIWASEASGFKHLVLHDADGWLVRPLTSGPWPVDAVVHIDEDRRLGYFTAGRDDPRQRHLHRVSLDGGEIEALTDAPGFHGATFAQDGSRYVHTWESMTTPPSAELCSTGNERRQVIHDGGRLDDIARGLAPPELVELSVDGATLYGALYRPADRGTRGATVVAVYGGPHAQMVTNTWTMTIDLRAQYLASRGFVVFKLDNRGSARRGLAFEGAVFRNLGRIELDDQAAGVRWLVDQGITDPERVGMYGWSYGGYMSALCLLKAPDVFNVAVAGAPVSDWDGYDTHYTERYMETPETNPDGYAQAALMTHVDNLRGRLLIVHGLVDENVHFRHSARLIAGLEHSGKSFDLLLLPEERHGVRPTPQNRTVRRLLEERVIGFFEEYL